MKSPKIMKNCQFMFFIPNNNLLCRKMLAKTLRKQGNKRKCKDRLVVASLGREKSDPSHRASSSSLSRLATVSPWRGNGDKARHNEFEASTRRGKLESTHF